MKHESEAAASVDCCFNRGEGGSHNLSKNSPTWCFKSFVYIIYLILEKTVC